MQKTYSEPELEWLKLVCIYLIGSYIAFKSWYKVFRKEAKEFWLILLLLKT